RGLKCLSLSVNTDGLAEKELRLTNILAWSIMLASGYTSGQLQSLFAKGIALSTRLGDRHATFNIKFGSWNYLLMSGQFNTALEVCQELLELAAGLNSEEFKSVADYALGVTLLQLGLLKQALERLESADSLNPHGGATPTFASRDSRISIKVH